MEIELRKSRIYNSNDVLLNAKNSNHTDTENRFRSNIKVESNFSNFQGVYMDQSKMDPRNWIYKASNIQTDKHDVGKFQVLKDKIKREFKRKVAEQKMQREYRKNLLEFNKQMNKINTTVHQTNHLLCSNFSLMNYKLEESDDKQ